MHLLQGPPLQPRLPEVSKRRGTPRSGEAPHHLHALPDPGAEPEVPAVAHGSVQMPYDEPRVLLLQVNGAQLGALSGTVPDTRRRPQLVASQSRTQPFVVRTSSLQGKTSFFGPPPVPVSKAVHGAQPSSRLTVAGASEPSPVVAAWSIQPQFSFRFEPATGPAASPLRRKEQSAGACLRRCGSTSSASRVGLGLDEHLVDVCVFDSGYVS